ncbi:hypothetical protein SEA_FUZZBUSTER_65 [Microbacterium phage FuzzBuster]|uniref:Uncharacterized protein n=1 Tax=Microbacterium phage FuzzBuster TaxID=2590935 RepID=A0A516KV35_9CAUD|nr:hypothetical protein SEA_FUZZBUSTER_65 [Microbacterium phage FuzzBuster]
MNAAPDLYPIVMIVFFLALKVIIATCAVVHDIRHRGDAE